MLDLCSSWVSHLPTDVEYAKVRLALATDQHSLPFGAHDTHAFVPSPQVVGHGMNAAELAKNQQLARV